jgi:hypothetical protein
MQDSRTPLQIYIDEYEAKTLLNFSPTEQFYKELGMGKGAFYSLKKGKRKPYVEEIKVLSKFFNIPIEDFFK